MTASCPRCRCTLRDGTIAPDDAGPTFDVYQSERDGAWVVHIETERLPCDERGPFPLRVYVNDDLDAPAYEHSRPWDGQDPPAEGA